MKQIIKQPNGLYCVFSDNIDNVTDINCTKEEVIYLFWIFHGKSESAKAEKIIAQLELGEKPYYQFTMSFSEMIDLINEVHGKEESENILLLTE